MNESFDAELRKRVRQYSEEPDNRLWNNIITRSEEERRPLTLRKRKRTGWILLAALFMVGGFYYLPDSSTERSGTPATEQMPSNEIQREADNGKDETASLLPGHDVSSKENELVQNSSRAVEKWSEEKIQANKIRSKAENVEAETASLSRHGASSKENDLAQNLDGGIEITQGEEIVLEQDSGNPSQRELDSSGNHSRVEQGDVTNLSNVDRSNKGIIVIEAINKKNNAMPAPKKGDHKKRSANEGKTIIPEKNHNRFSIYFTIMPTFGYQRINSNSTDNIIIESIDRVSAFSMERLGVRAELGAENPITERIKIFGGLVYYQRKQTIDYTEKQVETTEVTQGPDGEVILVPRFTHVHKSFEYELQNLGVQVGVSYQLSKKKLLHTAGTGFEFHFALNKLNEDEQTPELTNNPTAYVFYNFYYRLQYPAEGRLRAVFQPTLNYSFYIDQNLNAPFYVKPYGFGLNVGLTYNF